MSKPNKGHFQFYDSPLEAALQSRRVGDVSVSVVARRAVHRYLLACTGALPVLRLGEWCAIFDALNGCWMFDQTWNPRYVGTEVNDALGLETKWGIDQAALVARLMQADYGTCLALVDASERFWMDQEEPGADGWYALVAQVVGESHIAKEDAA